MCNINVFGEHLEDISKVLVGERNCGRLLHWPQRNTSPSIHGLVSFLWLFGPVTGIG